MDLCNRFVPRSIGICSHRTGVLFFYIPLSPRPMCLCIVVSILYAHCVWHIVLRRSHTAEQHMVIDVPRTQSRLHPSNVQVIAMSRCRHRIWSQRWWNYSTMSGLLVNTFHYFEITLAILLLGTASKFGYWNRPPQKNNWGMLIKKWIQNAKCIARQTRGRKQLQCLWH